MGKYIYQSGGKSYRDAERTQYATYVDVDDANASNIFILKIIYKTYVVPFCQDPNFICGCEI